MINQAGQSSYSQLVFKETFSGMKVAELMSTDLVMKNGDLVGLLSRTDMMRFMQMRMVLREE